MAASENLPPVADAGAYDPVRIEEGSDPAVAEVTLDGSGSTDPDGDDTIATYEWTDPDGTAAGTGSAVQVSLEAGEYVFTLVVTDDQGASDSASATITVIAAGLNLPPIADAGSYDAVRIEEDADPAVAAVTLDGSGSTDPDGDETIAAFEWFDGDGAAVGAEAVVEISLGEGVHVITLVVTDDQGEGATDIVTITVLSADAPVPESDGSGDEESDGGAGAGSGDDSEGDIDASTDGEDSNGESGEGSDGDSEEDSDASTDGEDSKKDKGKDKGKGKGNSERRNALRVLISQVLPNVPLSAKPAILKAIARLSERLGIDLEQIGVGGGDETKGKSEKGKSEDARDKGKGKGTGEDDRDGEDADGES